MKTLKVFAPPALQTALAAVGRVVASYESFVVIELDDRAARRIARQYPYEDMAAQYKMRLRGREFDPLAPGEVERELPPPPDDAPHHLLVQFVGPIKDEWIAALKAAGGAPQRSVGGFGYVVRADAASWARMKSMPFVRWSAHLPPRDRVATALSRRAKPPVGREGLASGRSVTIEVFDATQLDAVVQAAEREGVRVLSRHAATGTLVIELPQGSTRAALLERFSRLHGVARIAPRSLPRTCNNVAAGIVGQPFAMAPGAGRGLSGEGEIVAVCDTGLDSGELSNLHPDFRGRVIALRSYRIAKSAVAFGVTNVGADDGPADRGGHGTHVAGSVLGDGRASAGSRRRIRGMAPRARLVFQAVEQFSTSPHESGLALTGFPDDITTLFGFAYRRGARIHNNSWENEGRGSYDANCRQLDRFVWKHKDFLVVVAAGNGGSDSGGRADRGDGRINRMSVAPPGTSKNCITVGASESFRPRFKRDTYGSDGRWFADYPLAPFRDDPLADNPDRVAAFSARGPTKDGRIKPDLVAPGTLIVSTRSVHMDNSTTADPAYRPDPRRYTYMSGTSMATPITSGCAALLREALRRDHGFDRPTAALVKAWLLAGCVRLPCDPPSTADNAQGFGRINLERSLRHVLLLHEGPGLRTGARSRCGFDLPASGATLRIAMAYTDYPGHRLVNNLNLVAIDPSGRFYVGNVAGPARGRLGLDTHNNVEVLQIERAAAGRWTLDVVASNVPHGPQDFALAAVRV